MIYSDPYIRTSFAESANNIIVYDIINSGLKRFHNFRFFFLVGILYIASHSRYLPKYIYYIIIVVGLTYLIR